MQTRRMNCLARASVARMAAFKIALASSPRLLFAFSFRAKVFLLISLKNSLTESALASVLVFFMLLTCLTDMIRLRLARYAEIISAFVASNAVGAHVFCSHLIYLLAFIILVSVVNFALNELDSVAALAAYNVSVLLYERVDSLGLNFLILLFG